MVQFQTQKGKFYTVRGNEIVPADPSGGWTRPEEDWLVGDCAAIIDEDLWERAQAKFVRRRTNTAPTSFGEPGYFSGFAFCSHCGGKMHLARVPRKKKGSNVVDRIYTCSTYNGRGAKACNRNPIHEAPLLAYVVDKLQATLLAPENFERLQGEVERQAEHRRQTEPSDLKRNRVQLGKLDQEIKAAVRELRRTPDDLYDLAVAALRDLRSRREKLDGILNDQESRCAVVDSSDDVLVKKAIGRLQTLNECLSSADPRLVREALYQTVDRIDLTFENVQHKKMVRSHFKRGIVRFKRVEGMRLPTRRTSPMLKRNQNLRGQFWQ